MNENITQGKIILTSKGTQSKCLAEDLINFYKIKGFPECSFSVETPKLFGPIETILLSIVGTISSHFIIKLIDKLVEFNKTKYPEVRIEVYHVERNVTYVLPKEMKSCIEHFKED